MSTPASADGTTPLSAVFWTRVHRYRNLLRRRWWVLLLTCALALCVQAWRVATQPPSYRSDGQVYIVGRFNTSSSTGQGSFQEANVEFQKTTIGLLVGQTVRARAWEQLEAKKGGLVKAGELDLDVRPEGTLFTVIATGTDAAFTHDFLEETMQAFLDVRRGVRDQMSGRTVSSLREEIRHIEEQLQKDEAAIVDFQKQNGVFIKANDSTAESKAVQELQARAYVLKSQVDRLELLDPNTTTDLRLPELGLGAGTGANPAAGGANAAGAGGTLADSTDGDIRLVKNVLAKLQADYDDLGHDLKPAHPKMRAIAGDLARNRKSLEDLQKQSKLSVKDGLTLLRQLITRTDAEIKETKTHALNVEGMRAQLDALRAKRDRDEASHNELQRSLTGVNTNTNTEQDTMTILQHATVPVSVKPGWAKNLLLGLIAGLGAGGAILALLDRIDDRMGAFSDFQSHFSETVIGQIPRDQEARNASRDGVETTTELLEPDDERYQLVESYRNIRSSLLYMPQEGARPKTLLITSAIPNEGKSTIATNLAHIMAFAGMKTLLIDGDLRRGAIHEKLGLQREPGLTDVLAQTLPWREAVRTTETENLSFLPRGRSVPQPSEYLLGQTTDAFLQDIYGQFDYVIMDSSPVLAADDTASLAPKMDATLFVVRLGFTSAKMSRKALEILDKRQANVPGVILNFVDTTSPEFVYYQYPEYYHAPKGEDMDAGAGKGKNGSGANGHRPARRGRGASPVARG